MAYQSISVYNSPPLFQTLVAQGSVTPQFAFKLAETGSELFLGGTNPELYNGSLTYLPVTNQVSLELIGASLILSNCLRPAEGYWQITLDSFLLGENPIQLSDNRAVVDTGTTLIIGNKSEVEALYAQIPGSQPVDPKYDLEGFFTSSSCCHSPSPSH